MNGRRSRGRELVRRRLGGAPAGFLLLGASLLGSACRDDGRSAAEPTLFRISVTPYLTNAPLFIARDEGFFTEQRLNVEFFENPRSSDLIPALAAGKLEAQAGVVSTALLNAIHRGARIRIVADKGHLEPSACNPSALIVRKDLLEDGELPTAVALRGRRIHINPLMPEGYRAATRLEERGISLDQLEVVRLPAPTFPDAMDNGGVDLIVAGEPWTTRLRAAGHRVFVESERSTSVLQTGVIIFGPRLLVEHPDVGRRFMTAYLKAVRRFNEGKTDRNVEIVSRATGLDTELVRRACWPRLRDDGQIDIPSVLEFQSWAVRKGWLPRTVPADEFWEPAFVQHANRALPQSAASTTAALPRR